MTDTDKDYIIYNDESNKCYKLFTGRPKNKNYNYIPRFKLKPLSPKISLVNRCFLALSYSQRTKLELKYKVLYDYSRMGIEDILLAEYVVDTANECISRYDFKTKKLNNEISLKEDYLKHYRFNYMKNYNHVIVIALFSINYVNADPTKTIFCPSRDQCNDFILEKERAKQDINTYFGFIKDFDNPNILKNDFDYYIDIIT